MAWKGSRPSGDAVPLISSFGVQVSKWIYSRGCLLPLFMCAFASGPGKGPWEPFKPKFRGQESFWLTGGDLAPFSYRNRGISMCGSCVVLPLPFLRDKIVSGPILVNSRRWQFFQPARLGLPPLPASLDLPAPFFCIFLTLIGVFMSGLFHLNRISPLTEPRAIKHSAKAR